MLELLLIQCSLQRPESSGSKAFCVLQETSAGLALELGGAGQLVPTASSGVWEWAVHRRGQEEGGEVSVAGPGMFWLYYAVACDCLLTEVLWRQGERAPKAEGILGPAASPLISLPSGTGIAQFCLLIIKKG